MLDIVALLTNQNDYTKTRNYWKYIKAKLKNENSQLVSATTQLKLTAADGFVIDKYYKLIKEPKAQSDMHYKKEKSEKLNVKKNA